MVLSTWTSKFSFRKQQTTERLLSLNEIRALTFKFNEIEKTPGMTWRAHKAKADVQLDPLSEQTTELHICDERNYKKVFWTNSGQYEDIKRSLVTLCGGTHDMYLHRSSQYKTSHSIGAKCYGTRLILRPQPATGSRIQPTGENSSIRPAPAISIQHAPFLPASSNSRRRSQEHLQPHQSTPSGDPSGHSNHSSGTLVTGHSSRTSRTVVN